MLKMPLFGGKSKNPSEIVKALKESVVALEKGDAKSQRNCKKKPPGIYKP